MKKNLYQVLRDAAVSIDETLPEIRQIWCGVRDATWACIKFTLAGAVLIIGAGAWLGVGALLSNAHADTILGDVADCSQHRRCGYMKPVYRSLPPPGGIEFTGEWEGATAQGHNPRISCPAGTVQTHVMSGDGVDRDYTCWNINAPPGPLPAQVVATDLDACSAAACGDVEFWQGQYWGHWPAGYTPPLCPWPRSMKQTWTYGYLGVIRMTCAMPGT